MARKKNGRAAQGDGSIRQRSDGRWEARFTIGKDLGSGKQIQKSTYGSTQDEARKKKAQAVAALDEGTYFEPSKMTLAQWADIWLREFLVKVKPSSKVSYEQHIRNHIKPALGNVKLAALSLIQVQRFINSLANEKGLSPKTVKCIHGSFHKMLQQAVKIGYIKANPATGCDLPPIVKKEIRPLNDDEIRRFMTALSGTTYEHLFLVALFTGMRVGELLGLQWKCIDFKRELICVEKQLLRPRTRGAKHALGTLKNDKARYIMPAPFVLDVLRERKRKQAAERLLAGHLWDTGEFDDLVFTSSLGRHLCHSCVLRNLKRVLASVGIEEKRIHDLRHTYATAALRNGDNVKIVQETLGHYSAAFTLDQYGHVTDDMQKESASRMQSYIDCIKSCKG